MTETFETERLAAERMRACHFAELDRMHRDPQVMATLDGLRSAEESQRFLANNLAHWDRWGCGLWVFRDKPAGQFVGRAGLRIVSVGGREETELAYALMPALWGRGLATEMAQAILKLGFAERGLSDIVGFTLTTNWASRRVLEKSGFGYEREVIHADRPHVLYRIRRSTL